MLCPDQTCSSPRYSHQFPYSGNNLMNYPGNNSMNYSGNNSMNNSQPYNYPIMKTSGDVSGSPITPYQDPYHQPSPPIRPRQPINPDPPSTRIPVKRVPSQHTKVSALPPRRQISRTGKESSFSIYLILGIGVIFTIVIIIITIYMYNNSSSTTPPSNTNLLDNPNPQFSNDDLIILPKSEEVEYYDVDTGEILVPSQLTDFLPA